jgi:hypothetical protein
MSRVEVRRFINYLADVYARGYTLVSWDAMRVDWDILAAESNDRTACRRLALSHVDMMFHVVCARGHHLSLAKAARGMAVARQMNGRSPERLWASGNFSAALGHLNHDVRVTLELAHRCREEGVLRWTSRAGRPASMPMRDGWLTVREARHLPPPDVSGLESPASRRSLVAWMN